MTKGREVLKTQEMTEGLAERFRGAYGREPLLFRAPGRVNLIGEHTDYNEGFVLPAAVDLATYVAIAPRDDRLLRLQSLSFAEGVARDLDAPAPQPRNDWSDYAFGVALTLERAGHRLRGADILIGGDLPMGKGLSASAALEVAVGYALTQISGVMLERKALALICQRAENEFVGMRCGVMDQFISACGIAGCALLLDCRSLETRVVMIHPRVRLVACDSCVSHSLAGGEYNDRRRDCEAAAKLLGVAALRDVSEERLARQASALPERLYRRARHVVTEDARTLRFAAALESGDLAECGRLMNASHASLRDDFEVSRAELDLLADIAQKTPGVYGARMMGGGFGGCTINLVAAEETAAFERRIDEAYCAATGIRPNIFVCEPAGGAGPVHL